MKILWVTPKPTFPCEDGARRATKNLLGAVTKAGASVYLISMQSVIETRCEINFPEKNSFNEKFHCQGLGVATTQFINYKRMNTKSFPSLVKAVGQSFLPPFLPATVAPFACQKVKQQLMHLTQNKSWDCVVWDGAHAAASLWEKSQMKVPPHFGKSIYRSNNVESDLWRTSRDATNNPLRQALLFQQEVLMRHFERKLIENSVLTATVSKEDHKRFLDLSFGTGETITHTPIGFDFPLLSKVAENKEKHKAKTSQQLRLLFVGKLDWIPNCDGLKWFLKNVWPRVVSGRENVILRIVGSGDASWLQPLFVDQAKIEFLGRVDDLDAVYASTDVALVPIFIGSGARVKAIEAVVAGCCIVGTRHGVESAGLHAREHYLAAESPDEWIDTIVNLSLTETENVASRAFAHLRATYDASLVAKQFLAQIEKCLF